MEQYQDRYHIQVKSKRKSLSLDQPKRNSLSLAQLKRKSVSLDKKFMYQWEDFSNVKYLASGSFCDVFVAEYFDQRVALKISKQSRVETVDGRNAMEMEVEILKKMNNPNCIKLFGCGNHQGRIFLVLELLEIGTLDHVLKKHVQTFPSLFRKKKKKNFLIRLSICKKLAEALHYIHQSYKPGFTLIHRDLKPGNIGFSADGELKLMDFGMSRLIQDANDNLLETYNMTGQTGTLRYTAPEVALKLPYNSKVDVYSFGILGWQVLTLTKPFRNMSVTDFFENVVKNNVRPECPANWTSSLSNLFISCWEHDWSKRPTFEKIVSDMGDIMQEYQHSVCSSS